MFTPVRVFLRVAALLPGLSAVPLRAVPLDQAPWRGLVRVQTELGVRCTGFLAAPRIVVTAAHCLYLPGTGHYLQPGSVHVLLRYRFGRFDGHARVVRFVIPEQYDPAREQLHAGLDRAVLVLERPIGDAADRIGIATELPAVGTALSLGGYGQNREEVAVQGPPCHVLALRSDQGGRILIEHDCLGTHGTSGAPLLVRGADHVWRAAGVQIEARVGSAGGVAAAIGSDMPSDR